MEAARSHIRVGVDTDSSTERSFLQIFRVLAFSSKPVLASFSVIMYFILVSSIIISSSSSGTSIGNTMAGRYFPLLEGISFRLATVLISPCSPAAVPGLRPTTAIVHAVLPVRKPILHSSVHLKEHTLFSTLRTPIASASPTLFLNSKPAAASTRQAPMSALYPLVEDGKGSDGSILCYIPGKNYIILC